MSGGGWPALDRVLGLLSTAPARTGSVIVTVYGDAILPRGGSLALADLLVLMRRLGSGEGVVRTAVSRLAKDGVLVGRRAGRRSAYALSEAARVEFRAAVPRIYGRDTRPWDGRLRLAFPEPGLDRGALDAAGYAVIAPGVMMSPWPAPAGVAWLEASGPVETAHALVRRAWPLDRLRSAYAEFCTVFQPLAAAAPPSPLDAMAGRIMLIHAWRRMALRDPRLPAGLLPDDWPSSGARALCVALYAAFNRPSEEWLDGASCGDGPMPRSEDPACRFLA